MARDAGFTGESFNRPGEVRRARATLAHLRFERDAAQGFVDAEYAALILGEVCEETVDAIDAMAGLLAAMAKSKQVEFTAAQRAILTERAELGAAAVRQWKTEVPEGGENYGRIWPVRQQQQSSLPL